MFKKKKKKVETILVQMNEASSHGSHIGACGGTLKRSGDDLVKSFTRNIVLAFKMCKYSVAKQKCCNVLRLESANADLC